MISIYHERSKRQKRGKQKRQSLFWLRAGSNHLQTLKSPECCSVRRQHKHMPNPPISSISLPPHTHTCPLTHTRSPHPSFHTLMRKLIMDKQAAAPLNKQRGQRWCLAERGAAGWIFYWFCRSSCWSVLCTRVINIVCVEQSPVSYEFIRLQ